MAFLAADLAGRWSPAAVASTCCCAWLVAALWLAAAMSRLGAAMAAVPSSAVLFAGAGPEVIAWQRIS
eukprot:13472911-Heterocapsa_arctica.AAC.1